MSTLTVLDQLLVVHLDIHIWSARKKLSSADLGGANLPPDDLASLGSKRICNPEELRAFGKLKARAVNVLERNGIRFLGGWAVPETRMDEISIELAAIREEFNAAKEAFLQRYDQSVQDWIARHPSWAGIIAGSVVSEEYVRARLGFRWQMFKISPPTNCTPNAVCDNLHEETASLGDTLFGEIAKAAKDAWINCFAGKTEITRKALSPLKSLYDKLMGLTFVEPRVQPVAELLGTAFAGIPKRGAICGGTLVMLQGVVCLLQSPDALKELGQCMIEGRSTPERILSGLCSAPSLTGHEPDGQPDTASDDDFPVIPGMTPVIESHGLW